MRFAGPNPELQCYALFRSATSAMICAVLGMLELRHDFLTLVVPRTDDNVSCSLRLSHKKHKKHKKAVENPGQNRRAGRFRSVHFGEVDLLNEVMY